MEKAITITDEVILSKIHYIRGQKVMLDEDLAALYDVETKQLKRQVRRNIDRFPEDFMFELTESEFERLRSQIGTSKKGGTRYVPMVFTEQGVAMLSSVLNSERAIKANIQVIRIFTKMREALLSYKDILLKVEKIEQQTLKNSGDIKLIFQYIKELLTPEPTQPTPRIGFRRETGHE